MATLSGECLCGEVAYAYDGPLGVVVHCHCEIRDGLPQYDELPPGGDVIHELLES